MSKKILISILAIFLTVIVIIFFVSEYFPTILKSEPSSSPTPSPTYPYLKATPTFDIVLSPEELSVIQGETFQINVTMDSFLNETRTFTPELQLFEYNNNVLNSSQDSIKIYNATFNPEQLVLQQNMKRSTMLTISLAPDAPVAKYLFYVKYDNLAVGLWVTVVSEPNPSNVTLPTALPSPTNSTQNTSSAYESLTFSHFSYQYVGVGDIYNWTVTYTLTNTGNTTAIIDNLSINGKPYTSYNPLPTINPSIENGYSLLPAQSVIITMNETNSITQPFHANAQLSVLTATGNIYSYFWLGS
jgi:hypothetical protein